MLLYARLKYAGMVELADTQDLGSCGRPCRFKSCHPQFKKVESLVEVRLFLLLVNKYEI